MRFNLCAFQCLLNYCQQIKIKDIESTQTNKENYTLLKVIMVYIRNLVGKFVRQVAMLVVLANMTWLNMKTEQ